jgi:hypothetical protein
MPSLDQLDTLLAPTPSSLFPNVPADQLLSWQDRALHCVQSVCMKQALYLSLTSSTKVPERERISSALATFVAESKDNIDEEKINAFLANQYTLHGLYIEPNGRFLASKDFLAAFGFKQVFQSSVAYHLHKFCESLSAGRELLAVPDKCVAREVLPILAELAREIVASEAPNLQ